MSQQYLLMVLDKAKNRLGIANNVKINNSDLLRSIKFFKSLLIISPKTTLLLTTACGT